MHLSSSSTYKSAAVMFLDSGHSSTSIARVAPSSASSPPQHRINVVGFKRDAKRGLCVTQTTPPFQSRKADVTASIALISKWLVGSSKSKQSTGFNMNPASATLAFSPPDNSPIVRSIAASPVIPNDPKAALAI